MYDDDHRLFSGATAAIRAWGEERHWRGYDSYDGLNSPLAPYLTLGTVLGRRLLTQGVKLSPLNLRPLLRIREARNQKAIALVASGYARLAAAGLDDDARGHAQSWLDWLLENRAACEGMAWGYHFPVQTRVFGYPQNAPNTIATSFAAHALLDGFELVGATRWADAAGSAADFLVERMLHRSGTKPYFRYLVMENELVHNANVLACSVLARAGRALARRDLGEVARTALPVTLDAQRHDGAWPYADGPGHRWVDNYHTGYVLESLVNCLDLMPEAAERLRRGVDYWEETLFLPDGTPKYFDDRVYPLDAHSYAQAVETWVALRRHRPDALASAARVARLIVERMLHRRGYVIFQRWPIGSNRVAVVRGTTAATFKALAGLLLATAREAETDD